MNVPFSLWLSTLECSVILLKRSTKQEPRGLSIDVMKAHARTVHWFESLSSVPRKTGRGGGRVWSRVEPCVNSPSISQWQECHALCATATAATGQPPSSLAFRVYLKEPAVFEQKCQCWRYSLVNYCSWILRLLKVLRIKQVLGW